MSGGDSDARGSVEPHQENLRAGDADRQQVADRLRVALDEDRLTLTEYDERLGEAYRAQTYGELAAVTRDLPGATEPPAVPAERTRSSSPSPLRARLIQQGQGWLGGAVVLNGIWAVSTGLDWHHYWPGPVLAVWAIGTIGGAISDRKRGGRNRNGRGDKDRRDSGRAEDGRGNTDDANANTGGRRPGRRAR
ncbi:MAG TPA: DUF1707 domain-containing protein [Pseudonocardia sp.]